MLHRPSLQPEVLLPRPQSMVSFPALSEWPPLALCRSNVRPAGSYTCYPAWALGTETQNPCGIPECRPVAGQSGSEDFQIIKWGRQECHGLWVDTGTFIKKTATMKPQSPFPTGVVESWGMCRCMGVDMHVKNRNYFSREIISQDSMRERAR